MITFLALICVFFLGLAFGLAANLERIGRIARWRAGLNETRATNNEPCREANTRGVRTTEATP